MRKGIEGADNKVIQKDISSRDRQHFVEEQSFSDRNVWETSSTKTDSEILESHSPAL